MPSYIHGMSYSKEHSTWSKIKSRCNNPKNKAFKNYGGRGIKVCKRWQKSFILFLKDMGMAPTRKHSIDRIDNNGDYRPGNCRWATAKEQGNNTRLNHLIEFKGQKKTLMEWSEIIGFHYKRAHKRIFAGWDFEDVIKNSPERRKFAHCKRGHPYSKSNLRMKREKGKLFRMCRECSRIKERERYHKSKEIEDVCR